MEKSSDKITVSQIKSKQTSGLSMVFFCFMGFIIASLFFVTIGGKYITKINSVKISICKVENPLYLLFAIIVLHIIFLKLMKGQGIINTLDILISKWNLWIDLMIVIFIPYIIFLYIVGEIVINFHVITVSIYCIRGPFIFLMILIFLKLWTERNKSESSIIKIMKIYLEDRKSKFLIITLAFILFIWFKITQHYTFHTNVMDLSMIDDAIANTLTGNFMYTRWLGRNFFSEHFSPILLLLVPLYLIFSDPYTLVIVQAIAVVLSVVPLYILGKEKFSHPVVPFCIVVTYLNYIYLVGAFRYNFHMEIFEPLFIFSAFLFLRREQTAKYCIFLFLTLACKEDMPIYMIAVGLYVFFVMKKRRLGIFTLILCIVWVVFAWKIAIPMSYPYKVSSSHFLNRWEHFGGGYTQIAWGMLTHPSQLFNSLFFLNLHRLLYLLGYIPLACPLIFLIAIPPVLLNSASLSVNQSNLLLYYAIPIVPFLFIALIFGLATICNKFPRYRHYILTVICFYLLIMNVNWQRAYTITSHDLIGHRIINSLPENISISAQGSIIPHLPRTYAIERIPSGLDNDYIFFDVQRSRWPMSKKQYYDILQSYHDNKHYKLFLFEDGFYIFKRK